MRAGRSGRGAVRGFTLIEVLIAMTIFAISVSIVYALYDSIISVVRNVEDHTSLNNRAKMVFERINEDLSGLYRGEYGYLKGQDFNSYSDEPLLEFTSTAHLTFDREEAAVAVTIIRYYLFEEEGKKTYALLRSDTPTIVGAQDDNAGPEGKKIVMCKGLSEIKLRYVGRQGPEESGWDSTSGSDDEQQEDDRFPVLIGLEILFPDSNDETQDGGTRYFTSVYLRPGLLKFSKG